MPLEDRHKGILVAFVGILLISPDAVLVRFLSVGGTDPWVIIFWRLLISITLTFPYAVYEEGGLSNLWNSAADGKLYYLAAIPVQSAVDICFTFAFVYASAANALLVTNLNPLWCALLGFFFLGDMLPRRTIIALSVALGCMLIIFLPDIITQNGDNSQEDSYQYEPVKGNICALFAGVFLAIYITIMRKAGNDGIRLVASTCLSAFFASMMALAITGGNVLPNNYWHENDKVWQFWVVNVAEGVMLGITFICITVAPRLAKGAEVALVLLLEVILGPLWVYVGYGEVPSLWTLVGGSILLAVLAVHESIPLFEMAHTEIKRRSSLFASNKSRTLSEKDLDNIEANDDGQNDNDSNPDVEAVEQVAPIDDT